MRRPRIRFTLGELMGVIAGVAIVFAVTPAVFPAVYAVVYSIVLIAFACLIALLSARMSASRLSIALCLFSLYPLLPLTSLYVTWVTAWAVLGRLPRESLDDPESISPVVDFPYYLTMLLMGGCYPAVGICVLFAVAVLIRTAANRYRSGDSASQVSMAYGVSAWMILGSISTWSISLLLFFADPFRVLWWFMD